LEAGEGEKCVFYQQQAQRAKAESTVFKTENDQLKREVDKLRKEVEALRSGGGRTATKGKARALPVEFEEEDLTTTSKRPRRSAAVRAQAVVAAASDRSSPAPSGSNSSSASRRVSNASQASNHPSPATSTSSNSPAAYPSHQSAPVFAHSPLNEIHPASPASHDSHSSHPPHGPHSHLNSTNPHSGCGFCASSTECLCAEMGYQYASSSATPSNQQLPSALSNVASPQQLQEDVPFANETTYEPAVPLRLGSNRSKVQSVWRIDPPKPVRTKFDTVVAVAEKVLCSGDPSNCPACSDDPFVCSSLLAKALVLTLRLSHSFGKAFCTTLAATVCATPCANCPGNCSTTSSARIPTPPPDRHLPLPPPPSSIMSTSTIDAEEAALFESLTDLPCCGDPQLCGSLTCGPSSTEIAANEGGPVDADRVLLPRSVEPGIRTVDTVPCNEAWSVLKAHPNIAFASTSPFFL